MRSGFVVFMCLLFVACGKVAAEKPSAAGTRTKLLFVTSDGVREGEVTLDPLADEGAQLSAKARQLPSKAAIAEVKQLAWDDQQVRSLKGQIKFCVHIAHADVRGFHNKDLTVWNGREYTVGIFPVIGTPDMEADEHWIKVLEKRGPVYEVVFFALGDVSPDWRATQLGKATGDYKVEPSVPELCGEKKAMKELEGALPVEGDELDCEKQPTAPTKPLGPPTAS